MSYRNHADLGGLAGYGPVIQEPEEEWFHAAWEPRVLALTVAMGATGAWNLDMSRAARETLDGYAALSYYQIWIEAVAKLAKLRGMLSDDEVTSGHMQRQGPALPRLLRADQVATALATGASTERPSTTAPRFSIGERVRTRSQDPDHHSRLPRYARGKAGIVERVHGAHVFPDTHAMGKGESPEWLYTVSFKAADLWGKAAPDPSLVVSVDAWEPYLESV